MSRENDGFEFHPTGLQRLLDAAYRVINIFVRWDRLPMLMGAFNITAFRDRLLASPAFQRHAAGLPLTRLIARRRARKLFDLCAGFVYSQILLACVQLRLFDILLEGPQTLAALAQRTGLSVQRAERLLSGWRREAIGDRLVALADRK